MSNRKILHERRKQERFKVKGVVFAFIGNGHSVPGQIKNISQNGLAIHYLGDEKISDESAELAIYHSGSNFHLGNIPFNTVADFDLQSEFPISHVLTKQRCIRFGDLSQEQRVHLNNFIQDYTKRDA